MHVLTGKGWKGGFLPYHLHDQQVRIAVRVWLRIHTIDDAFVSYDKADWRKVVDYARTIGVRGTLRKIWSRLSEDNRNRKCVAIGWGTVVDLSPAAAQFAQGEQVAFVAPFHPWCVSEVCLHRQLVRAAPSSLPGTIRPDTVLTGPYDAGIDCRAVAGWSDWSGRKLDVAWLDRIFDVEIPNAQQSLPRLSLDPLTVGDDGGIVESRRKADAAATSRAQRKRGVIFGMGQYSKTAIYPRVKKHVDIDGWHEVDPTQIGQVEPDRKIDFRTSMFPEEDEQYDVYFVAGFHHTHAEIAVHGLRHGADVVVEKPLVTTFDQLDPLLDGLRESKGRFFAGFQKRYNPLNQIFRSDAVASEQEPISYRAIVHEIPLPRNHWYRWPNSRGKIISNGCHWIDHFLYLNGYCKPVKIETRLLANADIVVLIDLENGASFSLVLTDHGSSRLGVREVVWLTARDCTATIVDDWQYSSESTRRYIRRMRLHRHVACDRMYEEIGQQLAGNAPGDSIDSVEVSAKAVLLADQQLSVLLA